MKSEFVFGTGGHVADLGVAQMRLLLSGEQSGGRLSAGEFRGRPGPWTVPHLHRDLDELFYVVDGAFEFSCGDMEYTADTGALVLVPRGTTHVFSATKDGTVLVVWAPGGLEQMFLELGRLPSDSLTNPVVRSEIANRYDSIPV